MANDVPAFLEVGTPVSAKFKGAFCEATIKSLKKNVKCKVQFKDVISSSAVVHDDAIDGPLKVNAVVQVLLGDERKEAVIQKINDHSWYTVVFDDGDERTLRRTNVCVMGEKHFNEHENLDNLPLTDPENFSSMVVMPADKRRKRRRSHLNCSIEEEDSENDELKWNHDNKKLNENNKAYLGKVVCIEQGERKKSWFPALGLKHYNNTENQVYVQSFKDGKKFHVKKEDIIEFSKDKDPLCSFLKGDTKVDPILRSAIDKALSYHDLGELPKGWNILDIIDEKEDSSDDDISLSQTLSSETKIFLQNLYSFMEQNGTPITKEPTLNNQAVNLHKMFELVTQHGVLEEISNQQWKSIYTKLGLRNFNSTATINMKNLFRKYLRPYEEHLSLFSKSSPSNSPKQCKSKSKRSSPLKGDVENQSIVSESDSEPDRRRSSRLCRIVERPLTIPTESIRDDIDANSRTISSQNELDIKLESEDVDVKLEGEDVDVVNSPNTSVTSEEIENRNCNEINSKYKAGTRISVHYGSGKNQRLYNAKILEVDEENDEVVYYIHYNNWNHRYDEWVKDERIAGLSAPTKKRHSTPPAPLSKIAKDPPLRYKQRSSLINDNETSAKYVHTEINKHSKSPLQNFELPQSPQQSPVYSNDSSKSSLCSSASIKSPLYNSEAQFNDTESPKCGNSIKSLNRQKSSDITPDKLNSGNQVKSIHRLKPISDSLFIPDIKPSPVKPRMTRNSMQDTFLLNALEESIGKPNQSIVNSQLDNSLKLEGPRRSSRQQAMNQDQSAESDVSSKDGDKDYNTKKDEEHDEVEHKINIYDKPFLIVSRLETNRFDGQENSARDDSVKKWIEDSNNVIKVDIVETIDHAYDTINLKPEVNLISEETNNKVVAPVEQNTNNNMNSKKNNTETVRTNETHALNDFCSIVEHAPKLETLTDSIETQTKLFSPSKTSDKIRKKKLVDRQKRKRNSSVGYDDSIKSPIKEKKERKPPVLEYKIDFMSDLAFALEKKDSVQRIALMQFRLNEMSKLYCKLRSEVASIDRKTKRKLRIQLDNRRSNNV
ncbi:AT-rich interactive domain-containing protein 4B isoform X2 [Hydra vulgaris]|uniref:AT-rich interactive domain-containing protein 4B isoform X2 n=2 Tax=Hydra vulgaris TaxID=6087 RepID=A0ABM4CKE1_HYDVU